MAWARGSREPTVGLMVGVRVAERDRRPYLRLWAHLGRTGQEPPPPRGQRRLMACHTLRDANVHVRRFSTPTDAHLAHTRHTYVFTVHMPMCIHTRSNMITHAWIDQDLMCIHSQGHTHRCQCMTYTDTPWPHSCMFE